MISQCEGRIFIHNGDDPKDFSDSQPARACDIGDFIGIRFSVAFHSKYVDKNGLNPYS